jgi:hypothetical protein
MPVQVDVPSEKFLDGDPARCTLWDRVTRTVGLVINDTTPGHSKGALWVAGANVRGHATAWSAWYAADAAASASVIAYEKHTFITKVANNCVVEKCAVHYHRSASGQIDGSLSSPNGNGDGTATIDCAGKGETIDLDIAAQLNPSQGTTTTTATGTLTAGGVIPVGPGVTTSGTGTVQVVKTTKAVVGGGAAEQLQIISDDMTATCSSTVELTTVVSLHANAYDGGNKHVARMQVDIRNEIDITRANIKCDCEEPEHSMAPRPPGNSEFATRVAVQRQQIQGVADSLTQAADALAAQLSASRDVPVDKVQATLTERLTDLADTVATPEQLANVRSLQAAVQSAPADRGDEAAAAALDTIELLRGYVWVLQRLAHFSADGYLHDAAAIELLLADARATVPPASRPASEPSASNRAPGSGSARPRGRRR